MTDTQPVQESAKDLQNGSDPEEHDQDSLQEQARREKAEGEGDGFGEQRDRPSTAPPIANPD